MIHNLTIGHLDPLAIAERRAVVVRPLDMHAVRAHLAELGQPDGAGRWRLDGMPVEEKDGWLVCRWMVGPRRNHVVEELAIRLHRQIGCVLADREHGRVIEPSQLVGLEELGVAEGV